MPVIIVWKNIFLLISFCVYYCVRHNITTSWSVCFCVCVEEALRGFCGCTEVCYFSLYPVISHISGSSGVCGRRPVNFQHAVLIGPSPTFLPNSVTKNMVALVSFFAKWRLLFPASTGGHLCLKVDLGQVLLISTILNFFS